MKKSILIILAVAAAGLILIFIFWRDGAARPNDSALTDSSKISTAPPQTSNMKISSTVFANQQNIPEKYTCNGDNINPPLEIYDVPEGAQTLALIIDDPDAPTGTWTHWTVWNINPQIGTIEENSVPPNAVQGKTSAGLAGYGGPCPPSGTHRYFFKLFALDTKLNLASSTNVSELQDAMNDHILESAELIGLYSHK